MHLPDHLFSGKDGEPFRLFVQNLLDTVERQSVQIEKLTEDNEKLRAELRHLKKQKGKPKIRPNVSDQTDQGQPPPEEDATVQGSTQNNSGPPPKGKRQKSNPPVKQHHLPLRLTGKRSAKFPTHRKAGGSKATMIPFILT